jgi:TatA/E family protein of Tat protein translocase
VFNFSGQEFFIIAVFALLLFGPDKIPQLARTIGRFTREFNKYKSIMEQTLNAEIYRAEGPTKETITIEERIAKAGAASTAFSAAREPEGADELSDDPAAPAGVEAPAAPEAAPRPSTAPSADEADEEDEE